jgi:hypothetical protein
MPWISLSEGISMTRQSLSRASAVPVSLRSLRTTKEDMDIIRARLKVAEALAKELRHGKAHD